MQKPQKLEQARSRLKVEPECASCILSRASAEAKEATTNPALRFRCMNEVLRLLYKEFKPTACPADLGTARDRIIKRISGNDDPYKRNKKISNEKALKLLPYAKKLVDQSYAQEDRFKKACLCAIVGNIMEFDIPGHRFNFSSLRRSFQDAAKELVIDDITEVYALVRRARSSLYLADNAGEIVFDTLLVEQLKNMGLSVTVAVKSAPIINDATLEDAEVSGMKKIADKVITTGTDAVGFMPKEASEEFLEACGSVDIVFAKGMGYAETLTEHKLNKPHVMLLRTKCNPVANHFAAPREKNIAKLMPK